MEGTRTVHGQLYDFTFPVSCFFLCMWRISDMQAMFDDALNGEYNTWRKCLLANTFMLYKSMEALLIKFSPPEILTGSLKDL